MKFQKRKLDPVLIEIDGIQYPSKLTNRVMIELEEITGLSHIEFLSKIENATAKLEDIQTLLYVSLKGGGVELTLNDMLEADFTLMDQAAITNALSEVIDRAVGIATDLDSGEANDEKKTTNT